MILQFIFIIVGGLQALSSQNNRSFVLLSLQLTSFSHVFSPRYHEPCGCAHTIYHQQDCCEDGLICSLSSKICKPALGSVCTQRWIPGVTDCAKSSYMEEEVTPAVHCGYRQRCCIKSELWGAEVYIPRRLHGRGKTVCCSEKSEPVDKSISRYSPDYREMCL